MSPTLTTWHRLLPRSLESCGDQEKGRCRVRVARVVLMFEVLLVVTTLLCGLVAGLLFAYAVVAMPGIGTLDDRGFLRSFQVMDRVIQDNQPLFLLVWLGSAVALITAAVLGFAQLEGPELALLTTSAVMYVLGVQVPTVVVNIPLNNRLQTIDLDGATETDVVAERTAFEARWNRWNRSRTAVSVVVTASLLVLLLRL